MGAAGPQHPPAPPDKEGATFQDSPCRQTAGKGRTDTLGVHFTPSPSPLPPLTLAEGLLHQKLARVTLAPSPPAVTASPPAPSCPWPGRGTEERRAEKKQCRASPSHCCSPRHPPSPPDRKKPTSPRAPPARGWECGSNCTWQGSNSESKTVVWLVSHPGPAALLFSFACLNPFQPHTRLPAGPRAPSPAVERRGEMRRRFLAQPGCPASQKWENGQFSGRKTCRERVH